MDPTFFNATVYWLKCHPQMTWIPGSKGQTLYFLGRWNFSVRKYAISNKTENISGCSQHILWIVMSSVIGKGIQPQLILILVHACDELKIPPRWGVSGMFNWEKGSVHTWNTRERLRPTGLYMPEYLPENRLGREVWGSMTKTTPINTRKWMLQLLYYGVLIKVGR